MKHIVKKNPPPSLIKWYGNEKGLNRAYKKGSLDATILEDIRKNLLNEQGYLCCYTCKRIDLNSSHIEHIKPQTVSRHNRKNGIEDYDDVKYRNMLAAYPLRAFETDQKTGKEKHIKCKFGAEARDDKKLPIIPLQKNCEQRFSYNALGNIYPTNKKDVDARMTIELLKLDHEDLIRERKAVFRAVLSQTGLNENQAKKAVENALDRDEENRFKPFCLVLKFACELRLKKIERDGRERTFIRQARNRK